MDEGVIDHEQSAYETTAWYMDDDEGDWIGVKFMAEGLVVLRRFVPWQREDGTWTSEAMFEFIHEGREYTRWLPRRWDSRGRYTKIGLTRMAGVWAREILAGLEDESDG